MSLGSHRLARSVGSDIAIAMSVIALAVVGALALFGSELERAWNGPDRPAEPDRIETPLHDVW